MASPSMRIFKAAADQLGEMLKTHGFTYRKTQRRGWKDGRLFQHIVSINTSRSANSVPGIVQLDIRALAYSEAFGAFRRASGISLPVNDSYLFATQIENIFKPAPPYIRYDIGNAATWQAILEHVEQILVTQVFQAFELIESPERLASFLESKPMPCLDAHNAREDYFRFVSDGRTTEA
ncbi:MAG: hypothetical protein AAF490_07205 [Chloroflexota bacterium]